MQYPSCFLGFVFETIIASFVRSALSILSIHGSSISLSRSVLTTWCIYSRLIIVEKRKIINIKYQKSLTKDEKFKILNFVKKNLPPNSMFALSMCELSGYGGKGDIA